MQDSDKGLRDQIRQGWVGIGEAEPSFEDDVASGTAAPCGGAAALSPVCRCGRSGGGRCDRGLRAAACRRIVH